MHWADKTVLTKVSLPDVDRSLPFQPGSLAPILSIKGWTSIFLSFRMWRGSPRYFLGKLHILPRKLRIRWPTALLSKRMGKISVFEMFILSPNILRRSLEFYVGDLTLRPMGLQKWPHRRRIGSNADLPPLGGSAWEFLSELQSQWYVAAGL